MNAVLNLSLNRVKKLSLSLPESTEIAQKVRVQKNTFILEERERERERERDILDFRFVYCSKLNYMSMAW